MSSVVVMALFVCESKRMPAVVARSAESVFFTLVGEVLPPVPLPTVRVESNNAILRLVSLFALHARNGQNGSNDSFDWMVKILIFPPLSGVQDGFDVRKQSLGFCGCEFQFHGVIRLKENSAAVGVLVGRPDFAERSLDFAALLRVLDSIQGRASGLDVVAQAV